MQGLTLKEPENCQTKQKQLSTLAKSTTALQATLGYQSKVFLFL